MQSVRPRGGGQPFLYEWGLRLYRHRLARIPDGPSCQLQPADACFFRRFLSLRTFTFLVDALHLSLTTPHALFVCFRKCLRNIAAPYLSKLF